jgi:hypothetical protein
MVYAQLFAPPSLEPGQPMLLEPEAVASLVGSQPAVVVGSASHDVAGAIAAAGGEARAGLADLEPDARALALMAGDLAPSGALRPLYLRPPDVKPQADKSLPRAGP